MLLKHTATGSGLISGSATVKTMEIYFLKHATTVSYEFLWNAGL